MSIQMGSKSGPRDMMFMDKPMTLGFLTAEFQSGDPLGDDLDLQIVDRRPFEILPLGEPTKLKNPFYKKKQKDYHRERYRVARWANIFGQTGTRASKVGRHPRKADTPHARRTSDKTNDSRSTSCSTMQRVEEAQKRLNH